MKKQLIDYAPGTGVYEGDMRYGRANGNVPDKHGDYPANRENGVATNQPVVVLPLVQQRDPRVWTRDERVKEAKKSLDNSQHGINYLLTHLKDNNFMRVTIGKQRL